MSLQQGDIQLRCRDILRQVCNSLDIQGPLKELLVI